MSEEFANHELARMLYQDARTGIRDTPLLVLLLDLSMAAMEFERVFQEDFGARDHFFEAVDLFKSYRGVGPWLFGGAANVGWVAFHLARTSGAPIRGLEDFDDMIFSWIVDFPETHDVDLPSGLLGLGVYALTHPSREVREKLTTGVLQTIENRAEHDDGIFVRMAPHDARRQLKPHLIGHRDLGMAHGSAGLVSFLASAAMSDLHCKSQAAGLLDQAVRWLLRQRTPLEGSIFPHSVETRYEPSRTAWCYGDPGVSRALSIAAEATGSAEIAAVARDAAHAAVSRPPARARVVDASICHGAAGLLWFGNRVAGEWNLPGVDAFTAHWTRYVHEQRAQGPLHFLLRGGHQRDHSFLEGDLGVALALLAAGSPASAPWEERLLAAPIVAPVG